ncbi:hypothetical protein [Kineococcus sp. SYSU DK018]|uniref:hypothetical protein n=1 Tax=Kineococcus sp. SYSU DK018 TaxID=3383139 RepID=UPI003D7E3AEB
MVARRWGRGNATNRDEAELRAEVDRLTQEVVRLRLERQRPVGIGSVAEQLNALSAVPVATGSPGAQDRLEAQDQAHHVLAQAESMRQSLLDVLDQLVVAASQMQRQLLAGTSVMEIDRRVLDRRRAADRGPVRPAEDGAPVTGEPAPVQRVAG